MRVAIRAFAIALGFAAAGLATVAITARFRDGPFGPFPGGPLMSGPLIRGPIPDPETISQVGEVELQLDESRSSRLTWIVAHEGALFIPCGYIRVPLLKRWPQRALVDGRSTLRILGRRYPGRLVRVTETGLYEATSAKVFAKYGGDLSANPDDLWIFRFESAAQGEVGPAATGEKDD